MRCSGCFNNFCYFCMNCTALIGNCICCWSHNRILNGTNLTSIECILSNNECTYDKWTNHSRIIFTLTILGGRNSSFLASNENPRTSKLFFSDKFIVSAFNSIAHLKWVRISLQTSFSSSLFAKAQKGTHSSERPKNISFTMASSSAGMCLFKMSSTLLNDIILFSSFNFLILRSFG